METLPHGVHFLLQNKILMEVNTITLNTSDILSKTFTSDAIYELNLDKSGSEKIKPTLNSNMIIANL